MANELNIIIKAKDEASKVLSGMGNKAKAVGTQLVNVGKKGVVAFAATSAAIFKLTQSFGNFEAEMGNIATLIDTNTESMADMQKEVLSLSGRVPVALGDLTTSLYDVRSAGIAAGDAMGVLEASAQLGVAGLSSTKEATNIMTSALNAFKSEGLSASQVSDILFKTVKNGKTTLSELSRSFGATAPIIQAAGVSLADFSAATAALTTTGVPASVAQTQLKAAMVSLMKPSKDLQKVFKKYGAKDGPAFIKASGGIGKAFQRMKEEAEAAGVSVTAMAGSSEAGAAVLSLAGATNEAYVNTLKDMEEGSNAVDEAFSKQSETFNSSMQVFQNQIGRLSIAIGAQLAPIISKAAKALGSFIGFLSENEALAKTIAIILGVTAAVAGLASVLGVIGAVIPAVVAGVSALGTAFAILTGPIGLIILGIVAMVAAYQKFGIVKTIVDGAIKGIVLAFKLLFGSVIGFVKLLVNLPSLVGKAFDAVKNTIGGVVNFLAEKFEIIRKIIAAVKKAAELVAKFTGKGKKGKKGKEEKAKKAEEEAAAEDTTDAEATKFEQMEERKNAASQERHDADLERRDEKQELAAEDDEASLEAEAMEEEKNIAKEEADIAATEAKLARIDKERAAELNNAELTESQRQAIKEKWERVELKNTAKVNELRAKSKQDEAMGYSKWENFMAGATRSKSKEVAAIAKGLAIYNIGVKTAEAAMGAFNAMAGITIVGPILGAIAAAAAIAFGAEQIAAVTSQQPALAEGGIVPSTVGGQSVTVGEGGADEAIIPLDEDERTAPAGGGDLTVPIQIDGATLMTAVIKNYNEAKNTGTLESELESG